MCRTTCMRAPGTPAILELRRDWRRHKIRNAHLRAENERLAREVEALRTDPRVLEQVARTDMGWVRPGEILFDFGEGR
jgi:cell division protein FtsB